MTTETITPWIGWDVDQIIQNQLEFLRDNDPEFSMLSEEEQYESVCQDQDLLRFEWEDFLGFLDDWVADLNPNGWFYCEVKNFGWRKLNGEKEFRARNAKEFLREILPDTDCTFKIFQEPGQLRIVNRHHDNWDGSEEYIIRRLEDEDET